MLSFKEYFSNNSVITEEAYSHELIGSIGDRMDHVKNNILGRKSRAKIVKSYSGGVPVVFGSDPKTGTHFVSDGKRNLTSPEEIQNVHGDSPEGKAYMDVLTHMHKTMPQSGGTYSGQYLKFQRGEGGKYNHDNVSVDRSSVEGKKAKGAKFSLVVNGKGNKLADVSSFSQHPDVHLIDPVLKTDPKLFTPESQQEYNHNMMSAKKAYSSLKPDAFENLGPHSEEIQNFVNHYMGDKPPKTKDYMSYLTAKHTQEAGNKITPKQKDRVIRRLNDLNTTINPNVDKILKMNWHLNNAHNVLKNVISSHPQTIFDPDSKISVHHDGKITDL